MRKIFIIIAALAAFHIPNTLSAQVKSGIAAIADTEKMLLDSPSTVKPKAIFTPADDINDTVAKKNVAAGKADTAAIQWLTIKGDSTKDSTKIKKDTLAKKPDTVAVKKEPVITDPYKAKTYLKEIPFNRRFFHEDKIDKELRRADASDGVVDKKIKFWADTSMSGVLTKAILEDANFLQIMIENMPNNGRDSFTDHQERIRYLNAVTDLIHRYNVDGDVDPVYYQKLVANMHDMLIACNEGKLGSFVVKNTNVYTLDNSKLLFENHKDLRAYIYTRIGKQYPKMMIKRLIEYATDTFASTIIKADAPLEPDVIFNYATSTNAPLTRAVHKTKDPFVQAIVKIADQSKAPVKAMAFLGEVYAGRKTIAEIDSITADPELYFKSLVALKMANDTIARKTYSRELGLRSLKYIREMNELHEATDLVRFKCLDIMSPVDMYYIMVYGQDEIYTSSFLGSFKRLMEKMKPLKGNQFLDTLHYDHFRTFIRMCAGYNTLSDFLATMDDTARTSLMSGFIDNLQKGRDDDLEDAVDVADAFGSITDTALAAFLQKRVKDNYELSYKQRSKKGVIIYSLLARLFEGNRLTSSDTGAKVISERIGLPNINQVSFSDLVTDSGIVYQQVYFFGDEDGLHSYEHFTDLFRGDKRWKISTQKYWSVISSTTGKKVVIFANLPLPEPQDDEAIDSLCHYLNDSGIHPSIVIHRGHSYHLPVTLDHLNKQVKIVILGSCGGYHNLAIVLDHSANAHIISSKQTGTMGVNDEILRSLNNSLIAGQDANWINMWRGLEEFFNKKHNAADKDKFSDYVPPYKNLGAIFIKAYRKMMGMQQ